MLGLAVLVFGLGEALDSVIVPVVVGSITVQMLGFEICP